MRLFIAINFDSAVIASLERFIGFVKSCGVTGGFSHKENLHLTLVYIGETTKVADIKAIIDSVDFALFTFSINGLGTFKRDEGDIFWAGIKGDETLYALQRELSDKLIKAGFQIDGKAFKPHLTLGRKIFFPDGVDCRLLQNDFENITVQVSKISLMKSERIMGRLTYTEIYSNKKGR